MRASIQRIVPPTVITILAQNSTTVAVGAFYDFKIRDDGTNMQFYVGDLLNPVVSYSTTETFGNRIGFYNREN
ncbi:MAG TPA: hypothetical protein VHM28_06445, partial [Anaerolineales bacterium]|nr:hypothetical protein [Anaerolineales bacterium]